MFSMLVSVLFSSNTTFTRGGWGWAGPAIVTGAVVGTSIAASNAAARDRDYMRYRDAEARRREMEAERRHAERMAAINARNQGYVRPAVDAYYE